MSNFIGSLDPSSESLAYQLSSQESHQNSLTIDAVSYALQGVIQQLQYYSILSTASSQLEEIYNLKESERLSSLLSSWASGILVNQPSISLLDDAFLQGAKGAYAADSNHIYVAKSLTGRDSLTGLTQVLLEEYGHALDVYFNANQDTLGDEGEWFSLVVSGASLTRQDILRLQSEKDQSTLWIDNHPVTVEQSTTSLDFNSDQSLDILWRDPASGQNVVWFMGGTNNTQLLSGASLTTVGGGWSIKGISDFNGDSRPDLLWRDPVSGQNVVWFMGSTNNTQLIGSASLTTVGGGWSIKGISDFNGDSRPDLLWRDAASGQNVVWFMGGTNNTQLIGGASLTTVGGGWDIKGISDFNGDNRPDLLWRDAASGQNVVWFMGGTNNTQLLSGASLTTVGGGWDIKGINDFNGDNRPDLLWRDAASGQNVVWFMGGTNNTQLISGANLTTVGGGWAPILASWMPQTQPDLVVTNPYAPTSVNVGDSVTISAYTKNQGTIASAYNYLRYYLSNDTTLSSDDYSLGNSYVGSLATGSSEYDSFTFTYDSSWGTGTKYILFQADGYDYASENNENNNVAYKAVTISPPKPDLVVQNQYAPTSVVAGESITISVYTKNIGQATATGQSSGGLHYLRYWLSDDNILDPAKDRSLNIDPVASLAPNSAEYDFYSFTYDESWGTGTKYIIFQADGVGYSYGYVDESNEGNNTAYQAITVTAVKPDLVVQSQTAPTSANVGDSITVSAYTKNQGTSTAGSHSLRYYLSNDTTLSGDDSDLGYDAVASLTTGSSEYDSLTFIYNSTWGTGTKYILFQADGYSNVSESNENNNIVYQAITINPLSRPDLVITNLPASASITVGDSIPLSYSIKNQGTATAGSSSVYYWLSSDTVLSSDDYFLRSKAIGSIDAGSSVYDSVSLGYSSALGTGQKYILVETDGYRQVTESNESNNVAYQTITIYPPLPDLTIVTPSAPTSATTGNSITVSAYTKNQGTVASSSNYVHYWLSDDSTLSVSSDRYLGNSYVDSLAAGSVEYDALTFTYNSSWGTGTKYILFQADGYSQITESNESNNVIHAAITISSPTQPDLTITNQYAPTSANVGDSIIVSASTQNQGTGTAGAHSLRYYLSNDAFLSSDDYDLGYDSVASLTAGSSESDSLTFTYNSSWGTGTKYILFQADGYSNVSESNEGNNVIHAAITITQPTSIDLMGTYFYDNESILKAGNSYNFNFGIKNSGTSSVGLFQVGFYVSKDTSINASDYFLGSHSVSSLGAGSVADLSKYLVLPSAIDSFWNGQGTYYVGMIIDYQNSINEISESNNAYYDSSLISSFNIELDYTYDSSSWFDSSKRATLEAAADIWEKIILDEFVNIPTGTNTPHVSNPQTDQDLGVNNIYTTTSVIDDLKIFVGSRSSVGTLGDALAEAGPSGNYVNETRYTGSDFEPWLGSLTFSTSYSWFIDSTPEDSTVPFSQYDFLSVAVHEIGHVLGLTSGINAFSSWIYNSTFTGTNAKYYNGGNAVPLSSSSPSHIQDGYTYGNYGENAMDPTIANGKRKLPTLLDIAILDDIGYRVNYSAAYYNT